MNAYRGFMTFNSNSESLFDLAIVAMLFFFPVLATHRLFYGFEGIWETLVLCAEQLNLISPLSRM